LTAHRTRPLPPNLQVKKLHVRDRSAITIPSHRSADTHVGEPCPQTSVGCSTERSGTDRAPARQDNPPSFTGRPGRTYSSCTNVDVCTAEKPHRRSPGTTSTRSPYQAAAVTHSRTWCRPVDRAMRTSPMDVGLATGFRNPPTSRAPTKTSSSGWNIWTHSGVAGDRARGLLVRGPVRRPARLGPGRPKLNAPLQAGAAVGTCRPRDWRK
jgi:hypothetical protein